MGQRLRAFLRLESASGILMMASALLAIILANSPLASWYNLFLDIPMVIRIGALELAKPLLLWINDGLMAVFFLLVGLELKREMIEGQLADPRQVMLPGVAAVGGVVMPALFYLLFNGNDPTTVQGWAIPTATDIAFSLAVLVLLGKQVPTALKLFLLTLAILDDLAAVIIIALFYSHDLSFVSILLASLALLTLLIMNFLGISRLSAYVVIGVILWTCVLKSGVHATLAGVALAFAIPLRPRDWAEQSPLRQLEQSLRPWVSFGILPVFAFTNAGVSLAGMSLASLLEPVPLGIASGLFLGKQLGVFTFTWLTVRLGLARLPTGVDWLQMYGLAMLCGIGFTMSLFIGSLAFPPELVSDTTASRIGILTGSLLSAVAGYLVLRRAFIRVKSRLPDQAAAQARLDQTDAAPAQRERLAHQRQP